MKIGIWGASTSFSRFTLTKQYGAMKLVMYLLLGSVLVWIGLLAIYVEADFIGFNLFTLREVTFSQSFQIAIFPLFAIGFGIIISTLFAKTYRINKVISSSKKCRRVKITVQDTLYPVVIMYLCT